MSAQDSKPRRKLRPQISLLVLLAVAAGAMLGVKWELNAAGRQAAGQAGSQAPGQAPGQAARRGKVYLRWEMNGGLCNQVSWVLVV